VRPNVNQNSTQQACETAGEQPSGQPEPRSASRRLQKAPAVVFSLLVLGAVLSPVVENWRAKPRDGFPLSYYPMFSKKRAPTLRVSYLVGYDERGREQPIHCRYAGAGGLNQVRKQIRARVRQGKATTLCRQVAARVARKRGGRLADVKSVAVVTGVYDLEGYFRGNTEPVSVRIEAKCPVRRDAT